MKISVFTHWWSYENYGQMLQAYALQTILERQGHTVQQVRYCGRRQGGELLLVRLNPLHLVRAIKNRYATKPYDSHVEERAFASFKRQHLHLSDKEYFNLRDLRLNPPPADAYIVGSDQVWNEIDANEYANPWFLDFGAPATKRIAYAASFGRKEIPRRLQNYIAPLLTRMDAVSVREASGVAICRKAGCSQVKHVLDPTLLLQRDDYIALAQSDSSQSSSATRDHMMGYFLGANMEIPWAELNRYQSTRQLDLRITEISRAKEYLPATIDYYYPTIPQWISDIASCSCMVTNSFHGTAFAIIMRRPFLVFPRKDRSKGINERIFSLLETLGLHSRIYSSQKGSFTQQMDEKIDWSSVENALETQRRDSLNFLDSAGLIHRESLS